MLPILFRSVDRIVNNHKSISAGVVTFLIFTDATKNFYIKQDELLIQIYKTTNLQNNKLYTYHFVTKIIFNCFLFEPLITYIRNVI